MTQKFVNNFSTTVAATFGVSDTTLNLASVVGLPSTAGGNTFSLTLFKLTGVVESSHEIVTVTSVTGNAATVLRAQEGTTAVQFLIGDKVQMRITAASLQASADHAATTGNPHGLTKADINLSNVDNTSDINKPISTATQAALDTKVNAAYVASAVAQGKADLVASSPTALDTLNELAAALGNDPSFATTVSNSLGLRLRFDISNQGLTTPQQVNALTNLGIQNVENKNSATIRGEITSANVTTALGFTPLSNTSTTANVSEGSNKYFTEARVLASVLTGLSTATSTAVVAADSVLVALGKLQAQNLLAAPVANPAFTGTASFVGMKESKVALPANNIDLSAGTFFTKTISGATTLTVSNVPAASLAACFILDLTNAGSAVITWFASMKWAAGTAPTLTAAGRDVLGFFTYDAGTTWSGFVLGKDIK